ncbi:hypothetical protein NQ315_004968 [Exocentrus adspersus]|uniref:Protein kinase domain-containing protein n=1 Tax=Exocentrus adspersus TaxID=1586481 RepID=A0AAV8V824_9CUCU|nr:hypothetical protein NQ315_004968 [Exocentrus adspersus]
MSFNNLMIYRHPCIVKYVSSWQKNCKFYLAVEEVTPLSHVLPLLNTLQICVGLHSILKALHFLHEKASVSHNNICISSIYVTRDGSWKLGGMEYLCRYEDLSSDFLNKSRMNRYFKAVDSNEEKVFVNPTARRDFIDVYAFGVLVYEVFKSRESFDEVPNLDVFCDYCRNELQHTDPSQRPILSSILKHDFFNHEFINIHSFLIELPLKSDEEKMLFFRSLVGRLKMFNEEVVASQLGNLLLSRMVLLNGVAQETIVPFLLTPKSDEQEQTDQLFSEDTFKKYISPKLLEIISVRDAQIRLLLLNNFSNFMYMFTKEELQMYFLPELLVGIKDTNDHLVSVTLRTLADLVPVLGAATVIGGKRAKLFNDGRPMAHSNKNLPKEGTPQENEHPVVRDQILNNSISSIIDSHNLILPERSRPDGEEVETSTEEIEQSVDEDLENWDDWDLNENHSILINRLGIADIIEDSNDIAENHSNEGIKSIVNTKGDLARSKKTIADIEELDIKSQVQNNENDSFDFFHDMEPVINSSSKFLINEDNKCDVSLGIDKEVSSKLALNVNDINEEGWGDGDWD